VSESRRHNLGLKVEGLAAARGGRVIFESASFVLEPGATLLLKGPNGAGKTTLLRTLAGLAPAARGTAETYLDGGPRLRLDELPAPRPDRRAASIYAGHADGVKASMTGVEHLRFWARLYEGGADRIEIAAGAFDLAPFVHLRAGAMSAGQRRRLGLARLVISGKPIWLLDEPTAAMDAVAAARLAALILAHNAEGGAALVATHDKLPIEAPALILDARPPAETQ
jgi:heme exporter protein A